MSYVPPTANEDLMKQLMLMPPEQRHLWLKVAEAHICICCGKGMSRRIDSLQVCAFCNGHQNKGVSWETVHPNNNPWMALLALGILKENELIPSENVWVPPQG